MRNAVAASKLTSTLVAQLLIYTLLHSHDITGNGARLVTHIMSAMPPFKHRDPGPIGLLSDAQVEMGTGTQRRQSSVLRTLWMQLTLSSMRVHFVSCRCRQERISSDVLLGCL